MLKLAIIGTNWITHKFVEAALSTGQFSLHAVYSRHLDNATEFAAKYPASNAIIYTELNDLVNSPEIDAVYIASPNSLHAEQAMLCMNHKKHVIVEKPMASNMHEASAMYECALNNHVVLFEAFKTPYLPNFAKLKNALPLIGKVRFAHFNFCQYSSRYPRYLAGELPNTFNPVFSNGSLMDIGFYCVGMAVALFGAPKDISGQAIKLESGVDALGIATLTYDNFIVNIQHSKVSNSVIPSEIQGEEGNFIIEHLSDCEQITHVNRLDSKKEIISITQPKNTMIYEASHFAHLIATNCIEHQDIHTSLMISQILTSLRKVINVKFPADK